MSLTFITGADLVLPERIAANHTLVLERDTLVDILAGHVAGGASDHHVRADGCVVVPGFVDLHVHGVNGHDVLDGPGSIRTIARDLPRWGVTAFCPTTVACTPGELDTVLGEIAELRAAPEPGAARVLAAHLESNFINAEYRGAQPFACLRLPPIARAASRETRADGHDRHLLDAPPVDDAPATRFTGADILGLIDRYRHEIAIVTLAPELDGGLDLVRQLVALGIRVSLGHTGATFEIADAAIAAGARHATHLFNRMRPMTHRDPGVAGAVLGSHDVSAEIICDGHHVHPAMLRLAIAAKSPSRTIAITDGTAGSGLRAGSRAMLGGHAITVADVARLDDGTMAGSVATMDRALRMLISGCGLDLVSAARMCATTPAEAVGLDRHGVLALGAVADFVILTRDLDVVQTWIGGRAVS